MIFRQTINLTIANKVQTAVADVCRECRAVVQDKRSAGSAHTLETLIRFCNLEDFTTGLIECGLQRRLGVIRVLVVYAAYCVDCHTTCHFAARVTAHPVGHQDKEALSAKDA